MLLAPLALALLARAAALSPPVCGTASAPAEAAALAAAADAALVPSRFARVATGVARFAYGDSTTNFGTNPDGVYLAYFLDADAALPDGMCDAIVTPMGPLCSGMFTRASANETSMFVLGPADAVAFYGCTPPAVRYFGWDVVLESRLAHDGQPQHDVGTNFGDALNHLRANASSRVDGEVLVVHTADGDAARAVADGFEAAGASRAAANAHALDASVLRLFDRSAGADAWAAVAPDVLFALLRASLPANRTALDEWAALEWPVRLYLAADDAAAAAPLAPAPAPRENGFDEVAALSDAFVALQRAVVARWNASAPSDADDAWPGDDDGGARARVYDPRAREPGCFMHALWFASSDCSGDVASVEGYTPDDIGTCADARAQIVGEWCASVVDGCCQLEPSIAPTDGASARLCLSNVSLNDAVATCAWTAATATAPRPPRAGSARARPRALALASFGFDNDADDDARKSYVGPGVMAQSKASLGFYDDWLSVLAMARDTSVVGTRDALYGVATSVLPFEHGGAIVVVGVNHALAINASYSMLGVNIIAPPTTGDDGAQNLASLSFDDAALAGSARRYLGDRVAADVADRLFAVDLVPPGGCGADGAPWCAELDPALYGGDRKYVQIGERVYAVGASTVGARHDQTIAALALGFIDKADACAGTPDPPAKCAAGWAAAVAAGHADGCCGCAAFAPSAAACPDECADAMAAGCGEYLECEGVCATCFGQYSTFFCDGETLSVGVQCNGCDAASCAQVLTEATSPQVAQYRTCANGTRMTCAADGGLTMEAFSNDTTCAGTCASAGGWSVGPMAGWCGSDDDAACPDDFSGDGLTMMPGFAWCDHGDPAYDIVMSVFGAPRCAGNATQRLPWSADGECHDAPTPLVVACNASRHTMTVWDSCDTSLNSTTLPIGLCIPADDGGSIRLDAVGSACAATTPAEGPMFAPWFGEYSTAFGRVPVLPRVVWPAR